MRSMRKSCVLVLALLLGACSSGGDGYTYDPASDPDMVGPPGALLQIDDPGSPCDGVQVAIAPFALPDYRWIWLTDDSFNVPVTPWLPAAFWDKPRTGEGAFALNTSGETPYDLEITITLPISGITVETGQVLCAFYHDEAANRWRFVLPQVVDPVAMTMTIVTTFRTTWNWGRVSVADLDREYLEPALLERMGGTAWAKVVDEIDATATAIDDANVSYSCAGLRALQSGLLESVKQSAKADLLGYASSINGPCGVCDPLSDAFRDELGEFISLKLKIKLWELLADNNNNIVIEFACRLYVLVLDFETRQLACDYACVHRTAGGGFWVDYGLYQLAIGLQELIDWAIAVGAVPC